MSAKLSCISTSQSALSPATPTTVPCEPLISRRSNGAHIESEDLLISKQILGTGRFGDVTLGYWLSSPVACKRILPAEELTKAVLERLESEISALVGALAHPNLLPLCESGGGGGGREARLEARSAEKRSSATGRKTPTRREAWSEAKRSSISFSDRGRTPTPSLFAIAMLFFLLGLESLLFCARGCFFGATSPNLNF